MTTLQGRRVLLRPLTRHDFKAWREVRRRNRDRLARWEPRAGSGQLDVNEIPGAFAVRCAARHREWQQGVGYGFGIFVNGHFRGEMNLSSVLRGPFQSCYVGYWIDEAVAGQSYVPEALVVVARFVFGELGLHRLQVSIVPRNAASLRVVEKLALRCEGLAERYVEINGVWEDHYRFAMTEEEWLVRGPELVARWLAPQPVSTSRSGAATATTPGAAAGAAAATATSASATSQPDVSSPARTSGRRFRKGPTWS